MSKRGGGNKPWQEIDMNRVFNRFGYSLGWGRELFRRLTLDPFFKNLCKYRLAQKRLKPPDGHGNGCFVILIAFRQYLRWDEEPLFYDETREQTRHIRAHLRAEDLEISPPDARPHLPDPTQHCPVSASDHIKAFSTQRTAATNNNRARAAEQSTGFAACGNGPRPSQLTPSTSDCLLRTSLKTSLAAPEAPLAPTKSQNLRRKAIALTLEIKSDHWQNFPRTQNPDARPYTQVPFSFPHVFSFVTESLRAGYLDKTIASTWQAALHATHADIVDANVGRQPGQTGYRPRVRDAQAINLFHARRLIAGTDQLSTPERIKRLYRRRMIENERARKHHAKIEGEKAQTRIEAQKILAGASKNSFADQFRTLRESIANGELAKIVNRGKHDPIKNE